jgi:hypothetical protein
MKHILLAAMLAMITACGTSGGTGGGSYQTAYLDDDVQCPSSQEQTNQGLTRTQWRACFGDQQEDTGSQD